MSGSPRFYTLFAEFITALKESKYASGYLEDGYASGHLEDEALHKVITAYRTFKRCEDDEVTAA
jgi:hypothetical protein